MSILVGYTDFTQKKYVPQPEKSAISYGDVYVCHSSIFSNYIEQLWLPRAIFIV